MCLEQGCCRCVACIIFFRCTWSNPHPCSYSIVVPEGIPCRFWMRSNTSGYRMRWLVIENLGGRRPTGLASLKLRWHRQDGPYIFRAELPLARRLPSGRVSLNTMWHRQDRPYIARAEVALARRLAKLGWHRQDFTQARGKANSLR